MVNRKKSGGKLQCSLPLFSVDDCPESVPAAGWRNGTSLNNAGENGNYWTSTPNESNTQKAYNLNFNSSNQNVNWNNRNNGNSVRPVSALTEKPTKDSCARHFILSKEQLLVDLYRAYKDARKHKRGRAYQLKFEFNLEENLIDLRDELYERRYKPQPSTCFVIHDPKMREVFAANFRDRIVHHLFYNYTHSLFERTFIHDSYSCIKDRGTHYGIARLKRHIRNVSDNYSRSCFVLKIDISGYFMNINRHILMRLCRDTLEKMSTHPSTEKGKTWIESLDYDFIRYLLEIIIYSDPIEQCSMLGSEDDWNNLPSNKSLFHAKPDCGLPIGNLSSQLFSNVYLNRFDQYVKRELHCRHYGRYVDDAYIVDSDRKRLKSLIPSVAAFLESELGLSIHPFKTRIYNALHGVEFLGAYIKPFRTYVSASSLRRIKKGVFSQRWTDASKMRASVNSWLGVLSHYDSFCLRRTLFGYKSGFSSCGKFSSDWLRFE